MSISAACCRWPVRDARARPALRRGVALASMVHALLLAAAVFVSVGRRPEAPEPPLTVAFETVPAAQGLATAASAPPSAPTSPSATPATRSEPPVPQRPVAPDEVAAAAPPIAAAAPVPPLPLQHPEPAPTVVTHAPPRSRVIPARREAAPHDAAVAPQSVPERALPAASPPVSAEAGLAWRSALAAWLGAHRTYPEAARRDGVEGRVVVRFTVERDGGVSDVALVRGSGSAILDDAAIGMLRGAHLPAPPDHLTITLPIRYSLSP